MAPVHERHMVVDQPSFHTYGHRYNFKSAV
jgi:hypothetical protein